MFVGASASTAGITWELSNSVPAFGQGARSDVETVSSRPLPCCMCSYQRLASNSRTSSHSRSPVFRTWHRSKTGPSARSHVGIAVPEVALRWNGNIRSCAVSLVAVHMSDRIAWRACWSTSCHLSSGHPRWCSNSLRVFHTVWFVLTPRSAKYTFKSKLINDEPRSLCTYAGKPNKQNKLFKQSTTVFVVVDEHAKTNGNRLYSSDCSEKVWFGPRTCPLKSIDKRSHGRVALMRVPGAGLKNLGFTSAQVLQLFMAFFVSSLA